MSCRRYPSITSPCPKPPVMAKDSPSTWCALCKTTVHNLSALSVAQADALLARPGPVCVSYRVPRRRWAVLLAGALLLADGAIAQDVVTDEEEVLDEMVFTGGIDLPPVASVFLEEEPEAPPAAAGAGAHAAAE